MLQLKHLKLLCELTGAKPSEIKAVKFGEDVDFATSTTIGLASLAVPPGRTMIVCRVQSYMYNTDTTAQDYCIYRTLPDGVAYWELLDPTSLTNIQDWTQRTASRQLAADTDEFLFFPPNYLVQLNFNPNGLPPATGTFKISTAVFAYLVSAEISDKLQGSQDWITSTS